MSADNLPMIALYYWYVSIPKPSLDEHCKFHQSLCSKLNLCGRIRISETGLNGVLSGKKSDLVCYEQNVRQEVLNNITNRFEASSQLDGKKRYGETLDVKYCHLREDIPVEKQMFQSLSVKITQEVVSLNENLVSEQTTTIRKKGRGRSKMKTIQKITDSSLSSSSPGSRDHSNGSTVEMQSQMSVSKGLIRLEKYEPAKHLTPQEWNQKLLEDAAQMDPNAVLIDARNVYESNIGHFAVKGVPLILTNTRKYSTIPSILKASIPNLAGKNVYMYCTGGVRCERASVYLQALCESNEWPDDIDKPKSIYQLQGGIQKYLETYGKKLDNKLDKVVDVDRDHDQILQDVVTPQGSYSSSSSDDCLFAGKNFVFDNRRYDPVVGSCNETIGQCVMCHTPHDDYDNGHAPCDNKEARCCRCRVLVLVCNDCRAKVHSWGEDDNNNNMFMDDKPKLFCGGTMHACINEGNEVQHCQIKLY